MTLRSISYGGGVQSTALVVLACTGRIHADVAIFANVGEQAENPETLTYVRDVAMPYAADHGLEVVERGRGGKNPDLYERITRDGSRFLGFPVRLDRTGKPGRRSCTHDYKMVVVGRELKARGASATSPADVLIGISTDEWMRANRRRSDPWENVQYPLLDLKLSRTDCRSIIREAGLPVPPKSSCWFCPFHTKANWANLRTDHPDLFDRAADMEQQLIERRADQGKGPVWLSDACIPLRDAIPNDRALFGPDGDLSDGQCDSGWCMT